MSSLKYCKVCGNQIPQARVAIMPTAKMCVPCADGRVPRKLAITTVNGEGDHTWNDIQIVEETQLEMVEQRDILDIEPDSVVPEEGRPITILKRKDLGKE